MSQSVTQGLGILAGVLTGSLLLLLVRLAHERLVTWHDSFVCLTEGDYRAALGDQPGSARARHVSRVLLRNGHRPDRFFCPEYPEVHLGGGKWLGAEARACVYALRIRKNTQAENQWLVAFAGPNQDGAPMRSLLPLTCDP